jgi:hypothetical protein
VAHVSVAASFTVEDLYLGYFSGLPFVPEKPLKCCSDHSLDLLREMNLSAKFKEEIATPFLVAANGQFWIYFCVPRMQTTRVHWDKLFAAPVQFMK